LTNEGLNLMGVQRVLELETELMAARAETEALREQANRALADTRAAAAEQLRAQRRDLVPLRQDVVLYRDNRPGRTR